jgi:lysophospholipase L1-like esterase
VNAPISPEPFLRGIAWAGTDEIAYPRADPADLDRLPGDTVGTAGLPVSVRLELVGQSDVLELDYHTETDDLGYRGEGGQLAPAPRGPRWLAYGDSIAEGWIASGPAGAWPAVAARRTGLDVVNLGYAGSARGELPSAQQIAALDADVISISHGTNCWSRIPFSAAMFREQTLAFVALVRQGHPDTPIVVTSPILRPDAEETPNLLGATLVDLRLTMEHLTRELIDTGDAQLTLVEGGDLIGADDLPDGIHPGDHGHEVLADVFGGAVAAALGGSSAYTGRSLEG